MYIIANRTFIIALRVYRIYVQMPYPFLPHDALQRVVVPFTISVKK